MTHYRMSAVSLRPLWSVPFRGQGLHLQPSRKGTMLVRSILVPRATRVDCQQDKLVTAHTLSHQWWSKVGRSNVAEDTQRYGD